jgi:hypothetical protein
MKTITLSFFLCAVFLTGCASGPNFKSYNATLAAPRPGESRVWFYRPSKMIGAAIQPTVYLNEAPIGKSQPGAFFYIDKTPGTYEIKCSTEWADKAQLTVVQNQVSYVRLTMLPGLFVGHVLPKIVAEEKALKEIEKCRLITADGANKDWKAPEKTAAAK